MDIVDILLIVFAVITSLSKIIDSVTTIRGYRRAVAFGAPDPMGLEENRLGQRLFRRFGVEKTCWMTFVVWVLVVCGVCACAILENVSLIIKGGILLMYVLLTCTSVSTGIYNTTGRVTIFQKANRLFHLGTAHLLDTIGKLRPRLHR